MKELSIEEKAKRYDDLLVKLQKAKVDNNVCDDRYCCVIDDIVPELKESEDERIRKSLVGHFQKFKASDMWNDEFSFENVVAWLEKQGEQKTIDEIAKEVCKNKTSAVAFLKSAGIMNEKGELAEQYRQGEQKPADKVEPKFKVGDTIIKKHNSDINDFGQFTITDFTGSKYWYNDRIICDITEQDEWELYEPIRQEPAWSEEEENHVKSILSTIEYCKAQFPHAQAVVEAYNADIEWLNSLKPQKRWKPTKRMLEALEWAKCEFHPDCPETMEQLKYLYQELKQIYYERT